MKLEKLLKGFERAVVSFYENEFPLSFPTTHFTIQGNKMVFKKPKWVQLRGNQKACVLLHTHNEYVKKIRSVTLYGYAVQKDDFLEFEPKKCYKFKQGGLNTLKFIISGKRRMREFLKRETSKIKNSTGKF